MLLRECFVRKLTGSKLRATTLLPGDRLRLQGQVQLRGLHRKARERRLKDFTQTRFAVDLELLRVQSSPRSAQR